MQVVEIQLKNYKAFRSVKISDIPKFSVFVGANGAGKSTLFDVFGFLRDCLRDNVRAALQRRGGFKEVISRDADTDAIIISLKCRIKLSGSFRKVTYSLEIRQRDAVPYVGREILSYTRFSGGKPFNFIDFRDGQGTAITNEPELRPDTEVKRENQSLESSDILAIKGLGQFRKFEAAASLRTLIEDWHVSDFHISAARGSKDAGYGEKLSATGDNLPLVAQYLHDTHPKIFRRILDRMKERVPGVEVVDPMATPDGKILLRFKDGSFIDPFVDRFVSDGTIKMFAYLVLLYDPKPNPLLCVEEPENQLYPTLLPELCEEFQAYADRGGQVFVSTHSPDFLNYAPLESVFWLEKKDGYTSIFRASDDENLKGLIEAGDQPGFLWRQGMFGAADPR